jgi:SpoVK/Ycf46/Vps4 family AAA+-type ATPase
MKCITIEMNLPKKPLNFIELLDRYQTVKDNKYSDFIVLLNAINYDFSHNNYGSKSYVGKMGAETKTPTENNEGFYSLYSTSIWNNINSIEGLNSSEIKTGDTAYSLWKKTHETDLSLAIVPVKKIHYVNIDLSIKTLADIIKVIETYEYKEDTEYNIDLKALFNIKEELLQMNAMIGMEGMKTSIVDQLLYFLQDLHVGKNISEFKHTVIYGSPGTGKTEIAKIIGKMYSKLGVLKKNVFKKVTRNDLIAGYLGQTAIKTKKVIDECLGGVLFIDEAYSLANAYDQDSYSKECLDILCESLSDHKEDLMVIIAGYEEELENTFFRANKGLESRFIWRFKMDEYSPAEMMKIFKKKVLENEWQFENSDDVQEKWFREKKDDFKSFGRDMEMLFTYTKICHSRRIYGKDKECRKKISIEDLNEGYKKFKNNKKQKKEESFMHTIFI